MSLRTQRPAEWEDLPDIELYMDQVLTYMPRQQIAARADEQLTAAMVNNYIKVGMLEHAKGKKYAREHLAILTAICSLKQVLSVKDMAELLALENARANTQDFYAQYREMMDAALEKLDALLPEQDNEKDLSTAALELAVYGYACKVACERLLDILLGRKSDKPSK